MACSSTLSIILLICFSIAVAVETENHPMVGGWKEAVNEKGMIRIPVENPDGHSWFINVQMGTGLQTAQFCALGSNHALNAIYCARCPTCPNQDQMPYDHEKSNTYFASKQNTTIAHVDGLVLEGILAMDHTCIGMSGNKKQRTDPTTTVCKNNQMFLQVTKQDEYDWGKKATDKYSIDGICGLGHEESSEKSQGLIASAAWSKMIARNAYSVTFVPQKLAEKVKNSSDTVEEMTQSQIMATSFVTIGGWDEEDYTGDITWFDTGDKWDQDMSKFMIDDEEIVGTYDLPAVVFETGYPYIGLSPNYYAKVSDYLSRQVKDMTCSEGQHWGVCMVANTKCEDLNLDSMLNFTMNSYEFTIPLQNIAVYVNEGNQPYCQMQIGLLAKVKTDVIVIGGPFYTAFTGMFDTENHRLGFAQSSRGLEGNAIKCIGDYCPGAIEPIPADQDLPRKGNRIRYVILIVGILLLVAAICVGVCWYRNRADKEEDEDRDSDRRRRGKKGYTIKDEREDDSDEEDNLSIDYAKPSINK